MKKSGKKYEFTDEKVNYGSLTLKRIVAVRDFKNVKAGDLGGLIQSYDNLSHDGDCWVYKNGKVYDQAQVFEDAYVGDFDTSWYGSAVFGNAKLFGKATVNRNSRIFDNAQISGNVQVHSDSRVFNNAILTDDVIVCRSDVQRNAKLSGKISVREHSTIEHKIHSDLYSVVLNVKMYPYDVNYSGVDDDGNHFIRVGCQCHSYKDWCDESFRNNIIKTKVNSKQIDMESYLSVLELFKNYYNIK